MSGAAVDRLGVVARVWMPGRLKGIQIGPAHGTPFLAATQVFDVRPSPRKWLALERTSDAASRFVAEGTVLVTCSGSVGRATIASAAHAGMLVSHDLLRVEPNDADLRGWLYAYLRSEQARAMMTSAQYGHIIKHLEVEHLQALPVPRAPDEEVAEFARMFADVVRLRNRSLDLAVRAERLFEAAVETPPNQQGGDRTFTARASSMFTQGRRRFDASFHRPSVRALREHLERCGSGTVMLGAAGYEVWLPTRFRRVPAAQGIALVDSADLTEVSPDLPKRIADGDFGDRFRGRVHEGWVLMARSGQTYGIIGTTILAGPGLVDKVVSDHVMRIRPTSRAMVPPGYVVTALSHPRLGRPLVKSLAYGSSVPEIDPSDVASLPIVRVGEESERAIAEAATEAAELRGEADALERDMGARATELIARVATRGAE